MNKKTISMPLAFFFMLAFVQAASASHTIEGGTGSISSASGAIVVGEVYSNRNTFNPGAFDAYELGIQAVIDQTGAGNSSATWETGGVITRTVTLNATSGAEESPSFAGIFSLGSSSVTARVEKTNTLGSGHAEARIRTAGQVNNTTEGTSTLSGMAEITATASYEGLGSGSALATASGNASYSIKENTKKGAYGIVPMQVWGAVSGYTSSAVTNSAGGNVVSDSIIRSGSYAFNNTDAVAGSVAGSNRSEAGRTIGWINTTPSLSGPEVIIPQVRHNQILSITDVSRYYDGVARAHSAADSAVAESGAWDSSVNDANPRTKRASESVYSKVDGETSTYSATYLGGDEAHNSAGIFSLVIHNSENTTLAGASPMYTSTSYANFPADNEFYTMADSQRVTPGTDDKVVTSEAFVSRGNLTVKARDELPTTSVARLLQMSVFGAYLGSGSHLVDQSIGFMASGASAGFGASYTVGNIGGTPARDNMNTTHAFGFDVVAPAYTGNVLDDAGSYIVWGIESGRASSTQFMSRPTVYNVTSGLWENAYASMTTSIAGENATGWLSGDDYRFHMAAFGGGEPVVPDPVYVLLPRSNMIFNDLTTKTTESRINPSTSRIEMLNRLNAGASFQPANPS